MWCKITVAVNLIFYGAIAQFLGRWRSSQEPCCIFGLFFSVSRFFFLSCFWGGTNMVVRSQQLHNNYKTDDTNIARAAQHFGGGEIGISMEHVRTLSSFAERAIV